MFAHESLFLLQAGGASSYRAVAPYISAGRIGRAGGDTAPNLHKSEKNFKKCILLFQK